MLRQALAWINQHLENEPNTDVIKLIDEAGVKFNLTPLNADFLIRNFQQVRKEARDAREHSTKTS